MDYQNKYDKWLQFVKDKELLSELETIKNNKVEIEKRFESDLSFGTGGLRGILGAGTNRLNIYTVAKTTQGIANYLGPNKKVAVSYDSRINSELFAKVTCEVLAANGIKSYIYKELMPTPALSFAVRKLKCDLGIMITASHNPKEYNGYKVYDESGCQITLNLADSLHKHIQKIDEFSDVKRLDFIQENEKGTIRFIDDNVYDDFISNIKTESVLYGDEIIKDYSIIYTPLNGSGLKPATRILKELGFDKVNVVEEQRKPDGNFPTCPYPNPEHKPSLDLAIEYAKKLSSDLIIATDPDGDRLGVVVKHKGDYVLLTGNEVGILLFDFICSQKIKHNKMPKNPVVIKTIVTSNLINKIAFKYKVKVIDVLTGFKFIGEQIGLLEKNECLNDFIFGLEESCGYLIGSYVRDKDSIGAIMMLCEMFGYYLSKQINLIDKLEEIYKEHGYTINKLFSLEVNNNDIIKKIMNIFNNITSLNTNNIIKCVDYNKGINSLPKSNVLSIELDNESSFIIRPSGTEPKIKFYLSSTSSSVKNAYEKNEKLTDSIKSLLKDNNIQIK